MDTALIVVGVMLTALLLLWPFQHPLSRKQEPEVPVKPSLKPTTIRHPED